MGSEELLEEKLLVSLDSERDPYILELETEVGEYLDNIIKIFVREILETKLLTGDEEKEFVTKSLEGNIVQDLGDVAAVYRGVMVNRVRVS